MLIGLDSFATRLDLIDWDSFRRWNGGKLGLDGKLTGGEPTFAGRNFISSDFIWVHAEATDAMKNPSPENLSALNVMVPLIAPIQAPMPGHQQAKLARGFLSGRIDAHATCLKIYRSIVAGEFQVPSSRQINVWLAVNPNDPLSSEYWAGWSDTVNTFTPMDAGAINAGPAATMAQPFRACVICRYTKTSGKFRRDPQVTGALELAALVFQGSTTTCFAFWADAPDPDEDGVRPNPVLDWSQFDPAEIPAIWRFSTSYRDADGDPALVDFALDIVREPDPNSFEPKATAFMLRTQKWQPNVPSIVNYGFIDKLQSPGITNANIAYIQTHPFPKLTDKGGQHGPHYTLPEGAVTVIGRYLAPNLTFSGGHWMMTWDEAKALSNAGFEIFTIWENPNTSANMEPLGIAYFDPASHAGTEDGHDAFSYCGDQLFQPPHTPIFFCVDFDPVSNNQVADAEARKWIEKYFELIKKARDAYAQSNPDRYYLIGVYGVGEVLRWCYEQGIVSMFWQSTSTGGTGNTMPGEWPFSDPVHPFRPWYHANRWQFNSEASLRAQGWTYYDPPRPTGADPDVDWGDGGTWSLIDPLAQDLFNLEAQEVRQFIQPFLPFWAGFLP